MKYSIEVTESPVCIAHQLHLPYESKCNFPHGHNYEVTIRVEADSLDAQGMVVDFVDVKKVIKAFDHSILGRITDSCGCSVDFIRQHIEVEPSTAENFARHLAEVIQLALTDDTTDRICLVTEVRLRETPSSLVIYRPEV